MLDGIVDLYGLVLLKIFIIASLYKINNKKLYIKDKDFYICTAIYLLIQIVFGGEIFYNVRPFINFLSLIIICWGILKKELIQSLLSAIFIYFFMIVFEFLLIFLILAIARITTTISLSLLLKLIDGNTVYSFLINAIFAMFFYCFCSIKKVLKVYGYMDNYLYKNRFKKSYSLIFPIFLFLLFSFWILCFSNNLVVIISIYFVIFIFTSYIIFNSFCISNDYEKAKEKYTKTYNSLIEYEQMIDKYRINNHENKNQLQMIRNMIRQKDKFVDKYIDNLLDTVYTVNESIMMDVSIIPAGGLRATIYSKLVTMDNNGIKHIMNIDHGLRNVDFFENNPKITLKICDLLSIFIDNAIDEVKLQDDKCINLDIFLEDENRMIFEISNYVVSKFDFNKIFDSRYTTKSDGHGYGLVLAKEIIESETIISNETSIVNDVFIQKIIVII